jgi:hypothetical protein
MENLQTIKTVDGRLQLAAGLLARWTDRRLIVKRMNSKRIKIGLFNAIAGGGHDYKSEAVAIAAAKASAAKFWPKSVVFSNGSLKIVSSE